MDKDPDALRLQGEALEVFVNAVLNPPAPNEAALAAAERYKGSVEQSRNNTTQDCS